MEHPFRKLQLHNEPELQVNNVKEINHLFAQILYYSNTAFE